MAVAFLTWGDRRGRRELSWAAVTFLALVPLSGLGQGRPAVSEVSSSLVTGGVVEALALVGAAVLVVGVLAQELPRRVRAEA